MQLSILLVILISFLSQYGLLADARLVDEPFLLKWTFVLTLLILPAIQLFARITAGRSASEVTESSDQHGKFDAATRRVVLAKVSGWAWLIFSVLLVACTDWPDWVLAFSWNLKSAGLLLILSPALVSLNLFWFVQAMDHEHPWTESLNETVVRFKVFVLTNLIPLIFVLGAGDLSGFFPTIKSQVFYYGMFPAMLLILAYFLPLMISWLFPTRSLMKTEFGTELNALAQESKTFIRDIRLWGTGNRMVNAMIVGLVPSTRTVLISDRLLNEFPIDEIRAVFLHELGHARGNHLWQRFLAATVPFSTVYVLSLACELSEFIAIPMAILSSLAGLSLIARTLEYEADRFAVETLIATGNSPSGLVDALKRIRAIQPSSDRFSWLHPNITARIQRLTSTAIVRSCYRESGQ